MTSINDPLWHKLQLLQLDDPGASYPFSRRLAEENGWPVEYSLRVVEEYRKFIFLAVKAGHPVTPSDEVDQAWHLHLAYTRSYWDDMCQGILGKPLHHGPTKGGEKESNKFENWYERTLVSYKAFFGSPPSDIWPPLQDRFAPQRRFQRVEVSSHWLIPRHRLGQIAIWLVMVPVLLCVALVSCSAEVVNIGNYLPLGFLILCVVGLMVGRALFGNKKSGRKRRDGSGCAHHSGGGGNHGGVNGCSSSSNSGCGGGYQRTQSDSHDTPGDSKGGSSGCSSSGCSSSSGSSGCSSSSSSSSGSSGCGGGGCGGGGGGD